MRATSYARAYWTIGGCWYSFDAGPGFDVEEPRCHPALLLVAGLAVIELGRAVFGLSDDRIGAFRGMEANAEQRGAPQAVEHEDPLQVLVQALHRRAVDELELLPHEGQRSLRAVVGGLRVRGLELPPPPPYRYLSRPRAEFPR